VAGPKSDTKVGDVRAPWLWLTLIALAVVVFGCLLYLTSYKTFFYDEWDFIFQDRRWDLNLLFLAHNEHWVTVPILVWKILFVFVGIRTYLPYEAALLAVHMAAALLLFQLIRRRSGDLPAFGAALILLVLGGGGTDIVWAFQIEFVGAVAFGLLAMLLLDSDPLSSRRLAGASLALLGALMCSGVGLAFLAAITVQVLVDRRRRELWPVLVLPIAAFGVWFLFYGAGLPGTPGAPCSTCAPSGFSADIHKGSVGLGYLVSVARFMAVGLEASVGAIFAAAPDAAAVLVLPLAALFVWHLYRQKKIFAWQAGMLAGAAGWFFLVGLGRAEIWPAGATDSHYLYIGAVFFLPLVADIVGRLPWRGVWRPALVGAFGLVVFANAWQLRDVAQSQKDVMRLQTAKLQTVEAFRGAPDMQLDRSLDDLWMPQVRAGDYLQATAELGSPVPPATVETLKHSLSEAVDQAMVRLFGRALTVGPDASRSVSGSWCRSVDSSQGSTLDFQVPNDRWVMMQSSKAGDAFLFLGFVNPPPSEPLKRVALTASKPVWVHLPNTGKQAIWRLRIQTLDVGTLLVCSEVNPQVSRPSRYFDQAASFTLGSGWSSVADPAASSGRAVKAAAGASGPGAFGVGFVPTPGTYDIWYRVRVANSSSDKPQMIFALVDMDANRYIGSATFNPSQFKTTYTWVLVASDITPTPGNLMRFQTNISAKLTTDWYVDAALMIPAGSPSP
jgi:hypothetical protein